MGTWVACWFMLGSLKIHEPSVSLATKMHQLVYTVPDAFVHLPRMVQMCVWLLLGALVRMVSRLDVLDEMKELAAMGLSGIA